MPILLLQARYADDAAKAEEIASFARACGLDRDEIVAHDLLAGPPDAAALARCEALMVGGSGDFHLSQGDLPYLDETLAFVRRVVDRGPPTFASCFGYQCLVLALGGALIHDASRTEVGTFDPRLTEAGAADELFGIPPPAVTAQLSHKDRAVRPAAGTANLASSDLCPLQALRVPRQARLGLAVPSRARPEGQLRPLPALHGGVRQRAADARARAGASALSRLPGRLAAAVRDSSSCSGAAEPRHPSRTAPPTGERQLTAGRPGGGGRSAPDMEETRGADSP